MLKVVKVVFCGVVPKYCSVVPKPHYLRVKRSVTKNKTFEPIRTNTPIICQ